MNDKNKSLYKVVLPIIRNVIPNTIASDIVGVQPMSDNLSEVYSFKVTEHVCTEDCGKYFDMVHDFVKGYVWRSNCHKSGIEDEPITLEELQEARETQVFRKPIL